MTSFYLYTIHTTYVSPLTHLIIWGGFMLHYRNDARKMNKKIKEL